MKKLQVTGQFMLVDPSTGIEFNPGETVEVEALTHFIEERVELGQLAFCGGKAPAEEVVDYTPVFPPLPANPLDHDGDGKAGGSKPGPDHPARRKKARK